MKKLSLIISLFFSYFMFPQDPTFLWVKSIEGAVTESGVHSATDVYENLYLTGSFEGTVDFDPGVGVFKLTAIGNKDIYIVKLDSKGYFLWAKSFGSSGEDEASSVTIDKYGNIYTTGSFEGTVDFDPGEKSYPLNSNGARDIFLQKLNADGNLVWAIRMGGAFDDYGDVVKTDDDANIYLLQTFRDKVDLNPGRDMTLFASHGEQDIAIEKLNSQGKMIWVKTFGGAGFDKGNDMVLDEIGNIYITGAFEDEVDFDPGDGIALGHSNGYSDIFTVKFYSDGTFGWVRSMGGSKGNDFGNAISLDNQGYIYTTGDFYAELVYPASGEVNPEIPQVLVSSGGFDVYVQKLNPDGIIDWMKAIGNEYNDFGKAISADNYGNITVVGEFIRPDIINPDVKSKTPYRPIRKGVFIEQLMDDGTGKLHKEIANRSDITISSMATDYSRSIYLIGHFEELVDFDPGPAVHALIASKSSGAAYILKLSPYGNPQYVNNISNEIGLDASVSTYPNPVKNKLTIDLGKNIEKATLAIFDVVGNLVKRTESRDCSQISLDLNLHPGIYYVYISSENNTVTKKIIVE